MLELKDKVALVTGAANGIGAAIVREFLKEGVKFISILDINETSGDAFEKELALVYGNDRVKFFKCDVTKDEELFEAYEKTVANAGGLDVVVNNAGIANDGYDMYKKEIEINVTALVTSTLKALELMRQDKGGKGGTVINISSITALGLQSPSTFIYGATKAAVLHFTTNIGKEGYYSMTKVRTLCACLGGTHTDLIPNIRSFDNKLTKVLSEVTKRTPKQTPEDAAAGVVQAYKNGESGSTWLVFRSNIQEITDRVNKAYEIMSGDIFK